jgi:hypothetical protein
MINNWVVRLAVVALIAFIGCDTDATGPEGTTQDSFSAGDAQAMREIDQAIAEFEAEGLVSFGMPPGGNGKGHKNRNFIGILSGKNEVPPNASKGRGVAKFQLAKDSSSISYKLVVANISNVNAAHIHRAGAGINGPVVVGLYSAAPGGGRISGPIAQGSFTPADLTGPYAGSTDFNLFLADLHGDSLYVNVHTNDGVDPVSNEPGDLPGGEIRGQLRAPGHGHNNHGKGN